MKATREENDQVRALIGEAKRGTRGWLRMPCPWCTSSKGRTEPTLGLNGNTGGYGCLRCGKTGWLREYRSLEIEPQEAGPIEIVSPPDGFALLAEDDAWNSESYREPREYLLGRGFTRERIDSMCVGATLESRHWDEERQRFDSRYAFRIVVPVLDEWGRWQGFITRTWLKDGQYRYSGGEWRGRTIYNRACLDVETSEPALVVEGFADVAPFWPHACALMGKVSNEQWPLLLASRRPLCVCLDGDAHTEAWSMAVRLRFEGKQAGYVKLPPKRDPDDPDIRGWLVEAARDSIMEDL
jgi:hypothetical protein